MLRITRFIKKDKLDLLMQDTNISKVSIQRCNNKCLRDTTVFKVHVYITLDKNLFLNWLGRYIQLAKERNNNIERTTLQTAKKDFFIKESAFDDFDPQVYKPHKVMQQFMEKYNQQYFWDL